MSLYFPFSFFLFFLFVSNFCVVDKSGADIQINEPLMMFFAREIANKLPLRDTSRAGS